MTTTATMRMLAILATGSSDRWSKGKDRCSERGDKKIEPTESVVLWPRVSQYRIQVLKFFNLIPRGFLVITRPRVQ